MPPRYRAVPRDAWKWCVSHNRFATHLLIRSDCDPALNPPEPCCNPMLGGIMLPCKCVDWKPLERPIYTAPFSERLQDLISCAEHAAEQIPGFERDDPTNTEGLSDGEFAIGNWIVRPRFR